MNLIVDEQIGDRYIGLLLDTPQLVDPTRNGYLAPAVEVPFAAEHVIEIGRLPRRVQRIMFSEPPQAQWR